MSLACVKTMSHRWNCSGQAKGSVLCTRDTDMVIQEVVYVCRRLPLITKKMLYVGELYTNYLSGVGRA